MEKNNVSLLISLILVPNTPTPLTPLPRSGLPSSRNTIGARSPSLAPPRNISPKRLVREGCGSVFTVVF